MYINRPSCPHFWRVYKYKLLWYFSPTKVNSKETVKCFCTIPKFAPFPKLQRVKTVPKLQRFKAFPKLQRFKTVWNCRGSNFFLVFTNVYSKNPFQYFYLTFGIKNSISEPIREASAFFFAEVNLGAWSFLPHHEFTIEACPN